MAGNFIKYGASDPPRTAADLPVDSHELIALCAPRPCFISYGSVEHGEAPSGWMRTAASWRRCWPARCTGCWGRKTSARPATT